MGKKENIEQLEKEYEELEDYVMENEGDKNCDKEINRMREIQKKIAMVSHG